MFQGGAALPPANPAIFLSFPPFHKGLPIPGPALCVVMYMFRLAGHYRSSGMARRRDWISHMIRSVGKQGVLFRVLVVDVDFQALFFFSRPGFSELLPAHTMVAGVPP